MTKEYRIMGYRAALPEWLTYRREQHAAPVESTRDTIVNFVQRRPIESLAGALLVGVLVGWLLKRR